MSSRSHWSKWMIGVPGPRLSPEFSPVSESTELGRSLPRLVASATASRMVWRIAIWFVPTGTWTSKVGMPVSWQMAPWTSQAWSMFSAMMASDCEAREPAISACWARFIAARTSGGRLVDVSVISETRLSNNACMRAL
jgi:hypothetical protein